MSYFLKDFRHLNLKEKRIIIGFLITSLSVNLFTTNFELFQCIVNTIFQFFASWLFAYVFKFLAKKTYSSYSIFSLWIGWYIVMIGFTIISYFHQIM